MMRSLPVVIFSNSNLNSATFERGSVIYLTEALELR